MQDMQDDPENGRHPFGPVGSNTPATWRPAVGGMGGGARVRAASRLIRSRVAPLQPNVKRSHPSRAVAEIAGENLARRR